MRNIYRLLLIAVISLLGLLVQAQYISPGNHLSLSLDDLVSASGGVVSYHENAYQINDAFTLSATDTLRINEAADIRIAAGICPEFYGTLISDPADGHVHFTAIDTSSAATNFKGLRFNDSPANLMRNTIVSHGGGIQLISSEVLFEYCTFRHNSSSNVSAAITYSSCSPIIRYCYFIENERSAIGSGANVMGSPEIMHNILIRNTTDNSNRPQINLGPGAEDSLYIVGNYIEGHYDMAGGIGISNLMASGTTKAVIRNNYIVGNRYGFAQIGDQISAFIADNHFIDNDIQNEPNLGGSGLNFQGAANSNTAIVRRNYISGNLWGVTIQGTANPEFGTEDMHGLNVIFNNGNGGQTYALYNNTQKDVSAIGNYWGTNNPDEAENFIFHQPDQGDLGLVSYLPIHILEPVINLFMFSTIDNPGLEVDIYGEINQETHTIEVSVPASVDISNLIPQIGLELGVTSEPSGGIPTDYSEAVIYSISTPHGETAEYTVIVTTESETYTLSFDIKNTNGDTVTDAVITLNGNENPEGHYVFENLSPGNYSYTVSHQAYNTHTDSFELINQDLTIEVILEEKVALEEIFNSFSIYPQPFTDFLQISAVTNISYELSVFNIHGKQLIKKEAIKGSYQLDLQELEAGTYILIINFQGKTHAEKIIKL